MSTPLSATGRIVIPYTVSNLLHQAHFYVRNPTLVGSVYQINSRATDANDTLWTDAADGLVESMSYLLPATVTAFSDAVLQIISGTIWNPVSTFTPTATLHLSGSYHPGEQGTLVLRDVNFKKVKVVMMEGNQTIPWHWVDLASMTTEAANFAKQFTSSYTVSHAPYLWMVGRGDQYLRTSSLVGFTIALNRKIRRARGIA